MATRRRSPRRRRLLLLIRLLRRGAPLTPGFALALAAAWLAQAGSARAQSPSPLIPGQLFAAAELDRKPQSERDAFREVERELPEAGDEESPVRRQPLFKRFSSVSIDQLHRSSGYEGETQVRSETVSLPDLHLLDLRIAYDVRPDFVEKKPYTPVLDMEPAKDSPTVRGIKNLAEKEFFRQLRRLLKREWRSQLRDDPNINFGLYESRLLAINSIGREVESEDYYSSQVRQAAFRRGRDGEKEIPVAQWGPIMVLDSGGLNVDASVVRRLFSNETEAESKTRLDRVQVGPEPAVVRQPLLSGKSYKLNTGFRFDFNPFRAVAHKDALDVVNSYGTTLDVVWLTDILRRERFITEVEAQYRRDGELVVFFNFVMKSR